MGNPKLAILPSAQALTEKAWQALLKYVNDGGNLLITGPVDRDEHWQRVKRAAELIPSATVWPLTFHNAVLTLNGAVESKIPLSFDLQAQSWLETLNSSSVFQEVKHGKGMLFWAAYPVELAQGDTAAESLYSYVSSRVGLQPQFELLAPIAPGVMVYPLSLEDSVLYIIVSDNAVNGEIDLRDGSTGVRVTLRLGEEHAALILIGRKEKAIIYGSVETEIPIPKGKKLRDLVKVQLP